MGRWDDDYHDIRYIENCNAYFLTKIGARVPLIVNTKLSSLCRKIPCLYLGKNMIFMLLLLHKTLDRAVMKDDGQMRWWLSQNQDFPKYKHGIFRHRDGSFLFTIRGTRAPIFVRSYMVQFSIYRISRFSSSFRHFGAERRKLSLFLHDKMEISVKLLNKVVLCRTLGSFYPKQTPFFCSCLQISFFNQRSQLVSALYSSIQESETSIEARIAGSSHRHATSTSGAAQVGNQESWIEPKRTKTAPYNF